MLHAYLTHIPNYQDQYSKNYELLYNKFHLFVPRVIDFHHENLNYFYYSLSAAKEFNRKVTPFLAFLAIYEVNTSKSHQDYNEEDWSHFQSYFPTLSSYDLYELRKHLFKKLTYPPSPSKNQYEFLKNIKQYFSEMKNGKEEIIGNPTPNNIKNKRISKKNLSKSIKYAKKKKIAKTKSQTTIKN